MSEHTISVAILHAPWIPARVAAIAEMLEALPGIDCKAFDDARPKGMSWGQFKTVLAAKQWQWSLDTGCTHHLFLTDDLHLAPGFWEILQAMIAAKPDAIIGLLSNHPRGPELAAQGYRWYRCNSWVVGPAYLVPHEHLKAFLAWYEALPDHEMSGGRRWFNDDSALNEWITREGPAESWHPLPTCIEHRADIGSTVNHGDSYSRERVSWRETRHVQHHEDGFSWFSEPRGTDTGTWLQLMRDADFWRDSGPMLKVGGERETP